MKNAALGFRAHSGWAAYIAMAGPANSPALIERGRIQLADPRIPPPVQPYHKAAEMPFKKAEEFIRRTTEQTDNYARQGIEKIVADLRAQGYEAGTCGILLGSGRLIIAAASRRQGGEVNSPLPTLAHILGAHPLIHTAEGQLFRQAIVHGAEQCALRVVGIVERELFERTESALDLSRKELDRRVAEFGRALGPPWQQDQKFAALAAWLAL
jgi:hypothetical protein